MYTVTLISTVHSENGKCNSNELYKIIESIGPDVIFEELSNNLFDSFYNRNNVSDEPPEVKCIKKYLRSYNIKHLPVDIEVSSNLSTNDINFMFDTFRKYNVYNELENEQYVLIAKKGFAYLNSNKWSDFVDKKRITEMNLMGFEANKNRLFYIYKLFHEEQDNRENEMLQNIYNYSKENQYNQALFLIGAAHRNSIIQKINKYRTKEKLILNWTYYNN